MEYEKAKELLYSDGSYRDVYAFDLEHAQLDAFLEYERPMLNSDSFTLDGEAAELPKSYFEVMLSAQNTVGLLSIPFVPRTNNANTKPATCIP